MFRTAILTIAAAVSFATLANVAEAGIRKNGIAWNGIHKNGIAWNGIATAADALTFSAITLADGTKLEIVTK